MSKIDPVKILVWQEMSILPPKIGYRAILAKVNELVEVANRIIRELDGKKDDETIQKVHPGKGSFYQKENLLQNTQ